MCALHKIAWILVIVGALNWGLVALSPEWNVVYWLLGRWPVVERIVYGLVGLSALAMLAQGKCCGQCDCHDEHEHQSMPAHPGMGMPPKA